MQLYYILVLTNSCARDVRVTIVGLHIASNTVVAIDTSSPSVPSPTLTCLATRAPTTPGSPLRHYIIYNGQLQLTYRDLTFRTVLRVAILKLL